MASPDPHPPNAKKAPPAPACDPSRGTGDGEAAPGARIGVVLGGEGLVFSVFL